MLFSWVLLELAFSKETEFSKQMWWFLDEEV
jgi:hypothetical protein